MSADVARVLRAAADLNCPDPGCSGCIHQRFWNSREGSVHYFQCCICSRTPGQAAADAEETDP